MQNVQNPFQTEDILFEHVRTHTGESQRCLVSNTYFSREDQLLDHKQTHHGEISAKEQQAKAV